MSTEENSAFLSSRFEEELSKTTYPANPLITGSRIIDLALMFLREHGCPAAADIREALAQAYDDFVRPIDIPWIPNLVIEPKVDDLIKEAVLTAFDSAVEAVCGGYIDPE